MTELDTLQPNLGGFGEFLLSLPACTLFSGPGGSLS